MCARLLNSFWPATALRDLPSLERLYAAATAVQTSNAAEAAGSALQQYGQAKAQPPSNGRERQLDLDSIPMLNVSQSCNDATSEPAQALDWREALEHVAAAPRRGDMLRDSYKCDQFHRQAGVAPCAFVAVVLCCSLCLGDRCMRKQHTIRTSSQFAVQCVSDTLCGQFCMLWKSSI